MLVAQITDCHVVERGRLLSDRVDTAASLRTIVDRLVDLDPAVVVATGDLVNDGTAEQYHHLHELLAPVADRLVAVPGNHDDRTGMRRVFPWLPPGGPDDPIRQVVDLDQLRIVTLDTTVPGEHGGRLGEDQLDWLDRVLQESAGRPTLIAQHHPPFETGIAWMDEVGLDDAASQEEVVRRHDHVVGVVCGHVHRPVTTAFAGTVASCWPSTGAQVALRLDGERYRYSNESPALVLHRLDDRGRLTSHLLPVTDDTSSGSEWLPPWARDELHGGSSVPSASGSDPDDV